MRIRNSQGKIVQVKPKDESAIKRHIKSGNHKGIDDIVNSYPQEDNTAQDPADNQQLPPMIFGGSPYQQGGDVQQGDQGSDQSQQMLQMVIQALQQGQDPRAVVQMLVQKGIPEQQAEQLVQQALSQLQTQNAQTHQDPQLLAAENNGGSKGPDGSVQQDTQNQKHGGKVKMKKAQQGAQMQEGNPSDAPNGDQSLQDQGQQGQQQQMMQQMLQMVMQMLQQGQQPQQIMQALIQKGVPQQVAQQVIQMAMQQAQGQGGQVQQPPQQKYGGIMIKRAQLGSAIQDFKTSVANKPVDDTTPIVTDGSNTSPSTVPTSDPISNSQGPTPSKFNPSLTNSLLDYYSRHKQNAQANLSPTEQTQYSNYLQSNRPFVPTNGYLDSHFSNAAYNANQANIDAQIRKKVYPNDPQMQKQYGVREAGASLGAAGNLLLGAEDIGKAVATGIGTSEMYHKEKNLENEARVQKRRYDLENYNPYGIHGNSDLGGGENDALGAKFGKKMQMGGFGANVITERNEVINDTHNVYKDGGDLHSDTSGGNMKSLKPGSVIHSNSIGLKVGDMLHMMDQFSPLIQGHGSNYAANGTAMPDTFQNGGSMQDKDGQPITQAQLYQYAKEKLENKFKDPDKIISYADATTPFKTTEEDKELGVIGKKIMKNNKKINNPTLTNTAKTTALLNKSTLEQKQADVSSERDMKLAATGPEGPFHNMSTALKQSGAYGKDIQNEEEKQAKYGKKIKIKVPKAGTGYLAGQNLPFIYAQNGALTPEDYASYLDKQGNQNISPETNFSTPASPITTVKNNYPNPGAKNITPTGQNTLTSPNNTSVGWLNTQNDVENNAKNTGVPIHYYTRDEASAMGVKNLDPQSLYNLSFQVPMFQNNMNTPGGVVKVAKLMDEFGNTEQGKRLGIQWPTGGIQNVKDPTQMKALVNQLLPAYYDSLLQARRVSTDGQEATTNPTGQVTIKGDDKTDKLLDSGPLNPQRGGGYYQEGLNWDQLLGEAGAWGSKYEAAPFILNHGPGLAYSMGVQPLREEIQPEVNHIIRDVNAKNAYRQNSPEAQADKAQEQANAYHSIVQLKGQKFNNDARARGEFVNQQQRLLNEAGAAQADALRKGVDESYKGHSAFTDRIINAASLAGNKFAQNERENKQAALLQDMIRKYKLNPLTFGTDWTGDNTQLTAGTSYATPKDNYMNNRAFMDYARGLYFGNRAETYAEGEKATEATKKYGGKVKLPKKLPKKK